MKATKFIPAQGTDEDLVADARQLATELHRLNETLKLRGIEVGCTFVYEGGRVVVEYERVNREKL